MHLAGSSHSTYQWPSPKSMRKSCILRGAAFVSTFDSIPRQVNVCPSVITAPTIHPSNKLKIIMSADAEKWRHLPQDHKLRSTELPWYNASFEHKLAPSFRKLLEEWSGIAPEDIITHIYRTASLTRSNSPH